MNITETIAKELNATKELPSFKAGDTITVYYTIKEGDKERTQLFKGDVIQRKGTGGTETFTIRKISHSVGVERIFPTTVQYSRRLLASREIFVCFKNTGTSYHSPKSKSRA